MLSFAYFGDKCYLTSGRNKEYKDLQEKNAPINVSTYTSCHHSCCELSILILLSCFQFSSVTQSCPTLCDPMNCNLPGSSVHGILQARILEWVAISSSKWSSQPRDFFGRNDAKAEAPVLWPPDAKSWLTEKDSDAGRAWGQEEKGTTEDEMAGWHHWLNGRESEWTPGVGDGQGGLACCDSWDRKESDMTERLNWTELISWKILLLLFGCLHLSLN